ncbi:MAG: phosphoribosylanthranilate isomerase [Psychroserpens sp.]|nr:phosphoribosylanthranilate isomerase [Psychroserpens sp.]
MWRSICGMKYRDNIEQVAHLTPDYMGFIFFEDSSRYMTNAIPDLPNSIVKVGVFVNASITYIIEKINRHQLGAVQLHGQESPQFCEQLRSHTDVKIIKVFSILNAFDFSVLETYESVCDFYLFDTKGELPGGNGFTFDWSVLNDYPSQKLFFLSGGIGPNEINQLKEFKQTKASTYCHAIDVNSRFEIEAGLKNYNELEKFKHELQH